MNTAFLGKIGFGWWFGTLCCILFSFLVLLPVYGTSSIDNLKQQQQQIQQERENVVKESDRLTNLQTEAQKHLTGLNQNLQTTNSYIQESEARLKSATELLQQLEADLLTAELVYQERQVATVARLRYLQRSSASQGLAVLLQSTNITDFISRRYQLKLVYRADQRILAKLAAQAKLLITQRTEVEGQKNQIALIREQLLGQKADYQTQAQSQTELIQRLNSDRLALAAAQNQLEQDSQNLTVLIQQKIAEQIAREAAQAKTNSKSWIRGTGIFAFPSDAPTSSAFGWRIHPVLGYRRFHAGLDFAASYGSTIRAADSGIVIFAGWYGGYGKAVIIDHGKSLTTLYGHSSELYVTEGQSVQQGQAIASVGSTGLSTGPHLHFEVRRNGSPVDPANYL
ncbi:peptidoglycan DD-metalloendopeptidase family protein [Anabaena cylindrica FACHB-243]|uniref:Peptidase M23 n=1 Tax=Anabaena cylindrica (strain ATCC 27899 / PCC 7122) TaxID=272123 RepID=K9ZE74_ANACC|nr:MULTISPECIES: peptidoglycan DD-metalloendopeptidase family protein [Anabaena]AFZ57486.1 Peptidase M23 [Anabaena cylindrica PCC 7122]MBD2421169.1 peptidoglycan DD-metalloendopeptidase family protein [Anabaena cylindrica FACHB-243]MBY5281124.1 peptidoglycan DD-metalloendopeptidase family protein [Anabaena sp. CCAP 1446/1C]MBY5308534.1 peptidoglycan DD-metalloendopeptidase family protein [Anabaena sp. CCAP 1446/1C]MCM2405926.1 peptidoglycan DD-metalloendopeptidase family protein [Anabaena sp. 